MKIAVLMALTALVSGTASARSIQLDRVCGTNHSEKVMCVAAPCPALLFVRTEKGSVAVDRRVSNPDALKTLDNLSEGASLCISGQFQDAQKSAISAFVVEVQKVTDYVCKQTVNCMPIVAPEEEKYCTDDYVEWSKKNCGGAPTRLD